MELDRGINSAARCRWKLPLILGFAPSSLHRGQKTGGASFFFRHPQ